MGSDAQISQRAFIPVEHDFGLVDGVVEEKMLVERRDLELGENLFLEIFKRVEGRDGDFLVVTPAASARCRGGRRQRTEGRRQTQNG